MKINGFSEIQLIIGLLTGIIVVGGTIKTLYYLNYNSNNPLPDKNQIQQNRNLHSSSHIKTIMMSNSKVTVLSATGFPTADEKGIGAAIHYIHGFIPVYSGNIATFNFTSKAIPNCNVIYNENTGLAIATTSGC